VIYADTICDLGSSHELANYGEYSGAPSESHTYEYAKIILNLLTKHADIKDKVLLIGGGIANFTDVADTFKGIVKAIREIAPKLREQSIRLYVRRGGPNYQEGLNMMRQLGVDLDLPIIVHGPEHHMTEIVSLALNAPPDENPLSPKMVGFKAPTNQLPSLTATSSSSSSSSAHPFPTQDTRATKRHRLESIDESKGHASLFSRKTRAIIYGLQPGAVQNMLDFDSLCRRDQPSVACMVYPFSGNTFEKFYWKSSEVLIPIYQSVAQAVAKHPEVSVVVNFASMRSAPEVTHEVLDNAPNVKTIAIIAEGVPERKTRELIHKAHKKGVLLIGPATVGGLKAGAFRIGNTGGMLDNIVASKLYRPGSVAYVARSGGMSNEMNNM